MSEPKRIGKYDVTGTLGEGSFGIVYQGFDPFIKRRLAIKICTVEDHDLRRRFYREAEIAGRLQHKNIVTVFAFGTDGDRPYLVQELLDGEDLDKVIRRRDPLEHSHRLQILFQVARALDYAHRNGVVHRDVKPGNVRLLADGRVKLMDFGIAKLAGAQTQLTREGVTLGTASYLPPEQVRAEPLDHRADIFSFGVLAYELMAYERPFRGNTLSALVYQILYKVPVPLATAWQACPPVLSNLVARCMVKKPEERWRDFAELLAELEKAREAMTSGSAPTTGKDASKLDDTRPVLVPDDGTDAIGVTDRIAALVIENTRGEGDAIDLDAPTMMATGLDEVASEPLKQRAAEIGSLIAQGELQSAMRQLEDTVQEHLDGTREEVLPVPSADGAPEPAPATKPPTAMPSEADTQPTRAHVEDSQPLPVAAESRSPESRSTGPDATTPGSPVAGASEPGRPPTPVVDPSEVPTRVMAVSPESTREADEDDTRVPVSGRTPAAASASGPAATGRVAEEPATVPISKPVEVPPAVPSSPEPAKRAKKSAPAPAPAKPASATKTVADKNPVAGKRPAAGKKEAVAAKPAATRKSPPVEKAARPAGVPPQKASSQKSQPRQEQPAARIGKSRQPLLVAAAVGLVLLAVIWLLWGRSSEPEPPPPTTTEVAPVPSPVPSADPLDARPQGFARLVASPWAEVLEIADGRGALLPLPTEPFTPLLLPLAPGAYRIAFGHPDLEEPVVCELVIEVGGVAECAPAITSTSPMDYFKSVGWWR